MVGENTMLVQHSKACDPRIPLHTTTMAELCGACCYRMVMVRNKEHGLWYGLDQLQHWLGLNSYATSQLYSVNLSKCALVVASPMCTSPNATSQLCSALCTS